jgi:hypothetical protein
LKHIVDFVQPMFSENVVGLDEEAVARIKHIRECKTHFGDAAVPDVSTEREEVHLVAGVDGVANQGVFKSLFGAVVNKDDAIGSEVVIAKECADAFLKHLGSVVRIYDVEKVHVD